MTHAALTESKHSSSLEHVIRDSSADTLHMRLGLTVAVLVHVVLFVANWPSFARSTPVVPENQGPIYVVRNHKFILQPTPPPEVPWRRPVASVPIPDPTPLDPEPVRDGGALLPEFALGDWVSSEGLDVPPPPEVVQPILPRVGAEITAPRRVVMVEPVYPEIARQARKEGAVILSLIIGPSGRVESVEVLRSQTLGLTEAAVTAARQWVFEPSTYNGRPTAVQYILTVRFSLT